MYLLQQLFVRKIRKEKSEQSSSASGPPLAAPAPRGSPSRKGNQERSTLRGVGQSPSRILAAKGKGKRKGAYLGSYSPWLIQQPLVRTTSHHHNPPVRDHLVILTPRARWAPALSPSWELLVTMHWLTTAPWTLAPQEAAKLHLIVAARRPACPGVAVWTLRPPDVLSPRAGCLPPTGCEG